MHRRSLTVGLAALLAFGTLTTAHAQGPGGPPPGREGGPGFMRGPHGGPGFHGPRFAEELGLTAEQKAQMDALRQKNEATLKPLAEAARTAHETFRKALESENPDAAAVGQAALAMHTAEKALRAAHEATFEQMKAILTDEQRAKLEAMKEQRGKRGPRPPDRN